MSSYEPLEAGPKPSGIAALYSGDQGAFVLVVRTKKRTLRDFVSGGWNAKAGSNPAGATKIYPSLRALLVFTREAGGHLVAIETSRPIVPPHSGQLFGST